MSEHEPVLYLSYRSDAEQLFLLHLLREKGYTFANGAIPDDQTLPTLCAAGREQRYVNPYAVHPREKTVARTSYLTGYLMNYYQQTVTPFAALDPARL